MNKIIKAMLDASAGQFVSVDFIKADGSPRTVTGKLAPVSPSMANHDKYINIMLAGKRVEDKPSYRNVNTDTVKCIRMGGKEYKVQ